MIMNATEPETMDARPIILLLLVSNVLATSNSSAEDLQELLNRLGINTSENACMVPNFSLDLLGFLRLVNGQQVDHFGQSLSSPPANFIPSPRSTLPLVRLGGREYFFSKNQKATWLDARQFCLSFGMDLASVETSEENELLHSQLENLGLTNEWVLISGNKIGRAHYIWVNGSPIVFQDWGPNQPTEFATENCMIMWESDWYDLTCEAHTAYFICEQSP